MNNLKTITRQLLAFGETVPAEGLIPAIFPEAADLVSTDPYAFLIGVCLDRGAKAEIIWTIP